MRMRAPVLVLIALVLGCGSSDADPPKIPARKGGPREVAILGAGCFWGVEAWLMKAPGVESIDVGYAGGRGDGVTYRDVSMGKTGHAEAVRVVFDPSVISYEDLLRRWFFRIHDPTTLNRQGNDEGSQYRSAIFPQSAAQRETAVRVKAQIEAGGKWKKPLTTTIEPGAIWVRAEEEHQDYLVKNPGGYDNHYLRDLAL